MLTLRGWWYAHQLREGGEVASVRYLAGDYLAGVYARTLDGASDIFRLKFHQARLHLSGVPTPELLASRHFGLPPPVRSEQLMGIFPSPALVGNSTSLRGASFFLDADLPDGLPVSL